MKKFKIMIGGLVVSGGLVGAIVLDNRNDVQVEVYEYDNQEDLDKRKVDIETLITEKRETKEQAEEMDVVCEYGWDQSCAETANEIIDRRIASEELEAFAFGSLNDLVLKNLDPNCPIPLNGTDNWEAVRSCLKKP